MTDPAALLADPRVIWTADVLRFGDTDMNGHINNAVFAVFCESGRVNLFRTRLDATLPRDRYWVIAHLSIDFARELYYPGEVRTGTWVDKLGRTSITLAQAIIVNDAIVARATSVCVLMDRETRRPMPFDDATRESAERLLRCAAD
jgi:acyl-CoA thioester hydrolase